MGTPGAREGHRRAWGPHARTAAPLPAPMPERTAARRQYSASVLRLLLLLLPSLALAGPAEDVAVGSQQVVDQYCADVSSNDQQRAGDALSTVLEQWKSVRQVYDDTAAVYLLYWSGVLSECLSQNERALQDLVEFQTLTAGNDAYKAQQKDARRRQIRLERKLGMRDPNAGRPALVLGASMGAGSAVFGALSAWQGAEAQLHQERWYSGQVLTDQFATIEEDLRAAERARAGFLATTGALAATSATAVVVGLIQRSNARSEDARAQLRRPAPTFAGSAVPTPGGLVLSIGGQW